MKPAAGTWRPADCTVELLATGDGGEHWRSHPVPIPKSVPGRFLPLLYVLGEDEVVASWFLPGATDAAERRLRSEDGGRTWQPVAMPRVVTDTVPAIPDGALLVQACAKTVTGGARCAEEGFAVALPDGSVMINAVGDKGRTFLSEDGGRTFTEVERRYVGAAFWTRVGYLARPVDDVLWDAFQFSTDGVDWRDLTIG